MSFAVPTALAWAALAFPIVALYILKVRLRGVPVSTTIFWRQIFDEKTPRSIWQRLRHLISLLVQILLLMLLVFALAEPFFPWETLQTRRLVLILDNSASMQATDVAPSRLAAAKELGFGIISRLRTRDEMAVLTAGAPPRVVCGLTGHQRTLRQTLQAVVPTGGPTRMAEAVELARRLIGDHPRGQVVLLSDGCFRESESLLAATDVVLQRVGQRTANLGITQFQVRRSLVAPLGYEILVEVANASDQPAECRLEMDLEERPVDVVPLKLAPGQRWRQTFEKTSADGGRLTGRLKHADALSLDNEAVAILAPRQRQRVLLVTAGNRFLQEALQANSFVDLTVAGAAPQKVEPDTVIVFHRRTPQILPAGNVLVVDPANATELWELGRPLVNPIVTQQAGESPLMRHVRLDNVLMPQARQLRMTEQAQVLAGALSGDPLYCAFERPGGKVLVLTVNLDEGDLTFRTAFPILMTNALTWFAGRGAELQEARQAGSLVEIELPSRSPPTQSVSYALRSPDGQLRLLPAVAGKTTLGPLDRCGVWTVEATGSGVVFGPGANQVDRRLAENDSRPLAAPVLQLACNLADRDESDLRAPPAVFERGAAPELGSGWLTQPIWFYLIAAAWLLAAVEWLLYQRRWIS